MKKNKILALIVTMFLIASCSNGDYYTVETTDENGQKDTMILRSTQPPFIKEGGVLKVMNKGNINTVALNINKVTILKEQND